MYTLYTRRCRSTANIYIYIYVYTKNEHIYIIYASDYFFFTYCPVTMIETQPTDWRISSICENDWCPGR